MKNKLFILATLLILINCFSKKTPINSPLSSFEIEKLFSAKKIENIFIKNSEIQLSTNSDCAIALITDMEIDAKGNYIIADGWRRRAVFIFAPDGKFIKELGRRGQGPGEYSTPISVAISSKNEIWVADYQNCRINIYDKNFNLKQSIICRPRIYQFIHLNNQDEIYFYSGTINPFHPYVFDSILKYNDKGEEVISFAPVPEEVLNVKFLAIQDGMTIDRENFIYEMNPLYYNIRKFTADGKLVKEFSRKTDLFRIITKQNKTPIVVYGPYYLEKGLIMAQISEHLEIYDINGNFIVGELPFSNRIIATLGNSFYVEKWEEEDVTVNQPNPKIICYKLNI